MNEQHPNTGRTGGPGPVLAQIVGDSRRRRRRSLIATSAWLASVAIVAPYWFDATTPTIIVWLLLAGWGWLLGTLEWRQWHREEDTLRRWPQS